jgi:hypothetical protein
MSTAKEMGETLERLIDESGLVAVLEALATVCHEKADHVQSNWRDSSLDRCWRACGRRIETLVGIIQTILR